MTDTAISPLRQRMIEDMTVRGFTPGTQRGYIVAVRNFTAFLQEVSSRKSRRTTSRLVARRMRRMRRTCGAISFI